MTDLGLASQRRTLERFVTDNDELERLERLIGEFNLFEAIGAVRQELRHSDTLRFLLDPQAPHGLGDAVLSRFLKWALLGATDSILTPVEVDVADLSATEVLREWRGIDILLKNEVENFVVAVENKIDSGEHSNQLTRYRELLAAEFPRARRALLYLTPEGVRPSDEAWSPVSYTLIAETIDSVLDTHGSRASNDIATLMRHYLNLLRRYILSESDIAELCRQIYRKHRQALDLIFEHRPDSRARTAEFMHRLIADADRPGLVLDTVAKTYIRFALREWDEKPWQRTGRGWTRSHRLMLFELQNADPSIALVLYVGPGDDAARRAVYEAFCQPEARLRGAAKALSKAFTRVYSKKWLPVTKAEEMSDDELYEELQKRWGRFLENDLPKIREVAADIEWAPEDAAV